MSIYFMFLSFYSHSVVLLKIRYGPKMAFSFVPTQNFHLKPRDRKRQKSSVPFFLNCILPGANCHISYLYPFALWVQVSPIYGYSFPVISELDSALQNPDARGQTPERSKKHQCRSEQCHGDCYPFRGVRLVL